MGESFGGSFDLETSHVGCLSKAGIALRAVRSMFKIYTGLASTALVFSSSPSSHQLEHVLYTFTAFS